MLLRRFYEDKLAQASYMIGCQATGVALVVDPHRDSEVYLRAAAEEGLAITHVSETHIHADYLSGARQLARRLDATLLLSGEGGREWQYAFIGEEHTQAVNDGDEIEVGNVGIEILHTPGHTPEHISFMITDRAASPEPLGVLTGDFIFVGDVGRPDLLEKAAGVPDSMVASACSLFESISRFRHFPEHLQIWPGHGAGSACGKALGSVPSSTLGYEKLANWAFQCETEEEFVSRVLEGQPESPTYFEKMKQVNRDGPPILDGLPVFERLEQRALHDVLLSDHAAVVDIRQASAFRAGHLPGTISIPLSKDFPTWCGWLLPYDRPIYLVAESRDATNEAARDLALVGIDNLEGFFDVKALEWWSAECGNLKKTTSISWDEAEQAVVEEKASVVDVRGLSEWNEGSVPGVKHVHLGHLGTTGLSRLPRGCPLLLYCRSGYRSGIGTSILEAAGFNDVRNIDGGILDRMKRGLPIEQGVSPDKE